MFETLFLSFCRKEILRSYYILLLYINMFCSICGSRLEATNKFCSSCGHKLVEKGEASCQKDNKKDIKCLSFEQFAAKKRSTHFRTSKTKAKSKDTEPNALINIGLMKHVTFDTTTPVCGKLLPLKL